MLELAAPIPQGQCLMTYIFKALPDNFPYLKMVNNDGKQDCLICFCSAFPYLHNSCQLETCIAANQQQQNNQRLHIDLTKEPWHSKPESYWQPVVDWLRLPSVDGILRPTPYFKKLTPLAKWP
jgi:hypothetical protein